MDTHAGDLWKFRWRKRIFWKSQGRSLSWGSMIPGRLFRRAPLIGPIVAWMVGVAVHDLRKPDSRIKAFARRFLGKRKQPLCVRTGMIGQAGIEHRHGKVMEDEERHDSEKNS